MASCRMVAGAASDSMIVGIGLIIVSADAFTVGGASVPSPIDDTAANWMWRHYFAFTPAVAAESATELGLYQEVVIDSKAQRKIGLNEVIGFVWDGVILAGTPTADGTAVTLPLHLLS